MLTTWVWDDNVQTGTVNAGVMLAQSGLADFYQLSVQTARSAGYYCWRTSLEGTFVSSIPRSPGWHKFVIEVLPYTGSGDVNLYIDDQLAHSGNRKSDQDLSQIRLGISLKTPGSPFWYDDVNLSMVPEPASLVLLGLGACLIRRRRA